jgi:hypothetical protein
MSVITDKNDITLTCGFFNGENRTYDAEQMSSIFDGLINDGIYESIGDWFAVKASSGTEVTVGSGRAWLNHTWTLNDNPKIIDCGKADELSPRIDTIVIEVNHSESVKDNFIKVIHGEPGTNPVKPELSRGQYVNQYPLCYIDRPAGVDEIKPSHIRNCVGKDTPFVTGIVKVLDLAKILTQWEAKLDDFVESEKDDMDTFMTVQEEDFLKWYSDRQVEMQGAMDDTQNWTIRHEELFMDWFDTMKGQLSTDAAGNLQNQITKNEIEHMLIYGLNAGVKTISEDGSNITTIDETLGLRHVKSYNSDFSVCSLSLVDIATELELAYGYRRFSSDGSTINTEIHVIY